MASPRCVTPRPDTLIFEDDEVRLDDVRVEPHLPQTYVMFNKPSGYLTASSDPYGRPCLDTFLADMGPRVFPMGRLDKATTGLLLITDDGDLAHMMMHPEFHVLKRYRVRLETELSPEDPRLQHLRRGVELRDGLAAFVTVDFSDELRTLIVTLDEGRNRQVRRMFARVQLVVECLHREALGPLELDFEIPGEFRALKAVEVEAAWNEVGGHERVYRRKLQALRRVARRRRTRGVADLHLEEWLRQAGQLITS